MRTVSNAVPKKLHHLSTHDEETQLDFSAPTTVAIARCLSISTTTLPTDLSPAESEAKTLHSSPPSVSRPRAEGAFVPRYPSQVHQEEQHVTEQFPCVWQQQGPWLKETCIPLQDNKPKTSWFPETRRGVSAPGLVPGASQESAKGAVSNPPKQKGPLPVPCQEKISQPGSLGVYKNLGFPHLRYFHFISFSVLRAPEAEGVDHQAQEVDRSDGTRHQGKNLPSTFTSIG